MLAQEHPPERVIVVDDGSRDASAAVIRALTEAHDRVIAAILPRNVGASQARNTGVTLARADWIAFLDSDDLWLPGAAQALLGPVAAAADIVVGHFARIDACVACYRTVAGSRLVNDTAIGARNALRVLAHPYLAELAGA